MTFQERWAEGPPVGPAELLTPEEVRELSKTLVGSTVRVHRLCRDYLALWDDLNYERQISDDAIKELTFERDRNLDLTIKVDGLRKALEKFNTVLVDAYLGNTDD